MRLRAWVLGGSAFVAALSVSLFGGCNDDTSTGGGGAGGGGEEPDISDVVYQSEATDEALLALLAATPKDEPESASMIDEPADGAELPASPIPTFRWHGGGAARAPGEFDPKRFLLPPQRRPAPPRNALGLFLYRALENVPAAYAHGTPVNGPGFFLVFSTEGDDKLLRVFTLATQYTPDSDAWAKLEGADKPIDLTITSAVFEANRVLQDGGPWVSAPITFTIAAE